MNYFIKITGYETLKEKEEGLRKSQEIFFEEAERTDDEDDGI